MKLGSNLDFSQLQSLNRIVQVLSSPPSSPKEGQEYYNSANHGTYFWNATAWRPADAALLSDGSIQIAALATNPLNRSNHTGTQVSATISDLATVVQGYALSSFAVPTTNVNWNNQKITNLATPTVAGDAAEYSWVIGQVQSAAAGINAKNPVLVVATSNITLSGTQTIDNVAVVAGNRVLVAGQNTALQNGVYDVAAGAWTRSTLDGSAPGEIEPGALWFVTSGTAHAQTQWIVGTTGTITIGTTPISIVQFGVAQSYIGGNGINVTSYTISINLAGSSGLVSTVSGLAIDTTIVARKYATTIGDGSTTSIVVTHNLGTQDVIVMVHQAGTPYQEAEVDIYMTSTNTITLGFAVAPATNSYRVAVIG